REGDEPLPDEPVRVGILWSHVSAQTTPTVRELVTTLVDVVSSLGYDVEIRAPQRSSGVLHPGVQAAHCVRYQGAWREVGVVGEVHPDILDAHQIEASDRPAYGEIRLEDVAFEQVHRTLELPRFPASSRDLSLELDVSTPACTALDALVAA